MARPVKQGLDYFPLDVNSDDKIKMVEAKHEIAGFGVIVKLWQIIYENGYYIPWTERELLLYKNRINADINLINDVVKECLRWDLFNQEMYDKYKILTSTGIQKRYVSAIGRRLEVKIEQNYWLIDVSEVNGKKLMFTENIVNDDNNSINTCSSTQSKVKERKEYNIADSDKQVIALPTNKNSEEFIVRETYYEEMRECYPAVSMDEELRKMKAWLISNPSNRKTSRGMTRFINNWMSNAQNKARKNTGYQQQSRIDAIPDI